MSTRIAYLNLIIIAIGVPFLFIAWSLPFSFFVDIEYVEYQDVCAGETIQTVFALRDVKWADAYEGEVSAQLVRYTGDVIQETTIKRHADFLYEKHDGPIVYEIKWDTPLPAGHYGVDSLVKIDAVFDKTDFRSHEDQRFNVIDCL